METELKPKNKETHNIHHIPFAMSIDNKLPIPFKVISLRVLLDYENVWLIDTASPSETTHVLTIGTSGFNSIRNEVIDEYRASTDVDLYKKYKTDLEQQLNEIKTIEQTKLISLEQSKDKRYAALQIKYDLLNTELIETKNNIKTIKQQSIDELKAEYNEIITNLKTQITNLTSQREQEYRLYKERLQEEIGEFKTYKKELDEKTTKLQNEIITLYSNRETLINTIREEYESKLSNERSKIEIFTGLNKTSTKKGSMGETATNDILHKLLPNATIVDTHHKAGMGDFHITYNNVNILYENKNFTDNVPKIDREKFIKDVTNNTTINAGIMGSQQSGIGTKNNFEMEYTSNGKPLIYLHNTNDNIENIKIAIQLLCDNFNSVGNVSESKIKKIKNLLETIQQLTRETTQLQQTIEPLLTITRTQKQTIKQLEYKIKDIINEPDIETETAPADEIIQIIQPENKSGLVQTHPSHPHYNSFSLFKTEYIHTDNTKTRAAAVLEAWKELPEVQKKEYQNRARELNTTIQIL